MTTFEQTRSLILSLSKAEKYDLLRWIEDQLGLEQLIEKTPGVVGGRARIRGTRIPVWLLIDYFNTGWTEEKVLANYPQLNPELLRAAQAYYRENKAEIEADIHEQEE